LRTALPAVRAERRGERPRRPVHPVAESLARATAMKLRSLRTKLLLGTLLVIAFVMTAVMVVVDHRQRAAIIAEVQRRGEVIARNLAAISYGPLLLYNYTALEQNVARVAGEADVVYALVLDADGRAAARRRSWPDASRARYSGSPRARRPSREASWRSASSRRPPTRSGGSPRRSTTWPCSSFSSAGRSRTRMPSSSGTLSSWSISS